MTLTVGSFVHNQQSKAKATQFEVRFLRQDHPEQPSYWQSFRNSMARMLLEVVNNERLELYEDAGLVTERTTGPVTERRGGDNSEAVAG